jgi:hypothetical protein
VADKIFAVESFALWRADLLLATLPKSGSLEQVADSG